MGFCVFVFRPLTNSNDTYYRHPNRFISSHIVCSSSSLVQYNTIRCEPNQSRTNHTYIHTYIHTAVWTKQNKTQPTKSIPNPRKACQDIAIPGSSKDCESKFRGKGKRKSKKICRKRVDGAAAAAAQGTQGTNNDTIKFFCPSFCKQKCIKKKKLEGQQQRQ